MEVTPHARQEAEGLLQFLGSGGGGIAGTGVAQLFEPGDQLEVAKPAGSLLDVGLQVVQRVAELGVALAGETGEIAHQDFAVGAEEARQTVGHSGVERAVPGQEALVEDADVELDVLVVDLEAFGGRADGLADAQACVPELPQEGGDGFPVRQRQAFGGEQQQQVDIRVREQVAAAVSADGQQAQAFGDIGKQAPGGV